MTARATISVQVTDVNDRRPVFSQSVYTINYTELTNIVEEENLRQLQSDEAIVVSDEDSVSYPT